MTDNNQQNIIIYNTTDGKASVALYARDGQIWLNQQQMAELFATSKQTISHHIINILKEKELNADLVVKHYLTTASASLSKTVYRILFTRPTPFPKNRNCNNCNSSRVPRPNVPLRWFWCVNEAAGSNGKIVST